MATAYQSQYWAALLTLKGPGSELSNLGRSLAGARVDLNPHQVDAALFAFSSPLSRGVVLADEVGLGKTIEAALVLAQRWAERRRRILLIVPATLRNQWASELKEKFFLPTMVLESASYHRQRREGQLNPFEAEGQILVTSYNFAASKAADVAKVAWDLVVFDEAHRLRNVYKAGSRIARSLRTAVNSRQKLLLTATPLQNNLMELYGLATFIDPHVFGDEASFREQFLRGQSESHRNERLRRRLLPVCKRTLRRQVLEYVRFTQRIPMTWDFTPSDDEQRLYDDVSAYLHRDDLLALPAGQRSLITMVLRKLLASSSFAIAGTLQNLVSRLEGQLPAPPPLADDYESLNEAEEEWREDEPGADAAPEGEQGVDAARLRAELGSLRGYLDLARGITENAKGAALLKALEGAFERVSDLGARRKAVVFTESRRTQAYLFDLLESQGYAGKVLLLNGANSDQRSKEIYRAWLKRHEGDDAVSGAREVDIKAALVEAFREEAEILIATEAAAEGVNLQFCSLVVNFDLPWNPQRIEQRIGRCHRYGQAHDVVVVNFLNRRNEADQRVFELLSEKFRLFEGVFGSSDQVLGALESGVDVEKRIAEVYQTCRTPVEIKAAFDALQADLDQQITDRMAETRQAVMEHFDQDVQQRLGVFRDKAVALLGERERLLLALARAELEPEATFEVGEPRFHYHGQSAAAGYYHLDWRKAEERGDHFFRLDHELAQAMIREALGRELATTRLVFDYDEHGVPVAILAPYLGKSGWLTVAKLTVTAVDYEEHLVLSAVTDDGELLDAEWSRKLLELPAWEDTDTPQTAEVPAPLHEAILREEARVLRDVEKRNAAFFEQEVEKLDGWADDLKVGLERELKELDIEIKAARKSSKVAALLQEKLEAQRKVKELEQRRNQKRRQLFEAQDDIDGQRSKLIEDIERQLKTSSETVGLFTVRWAMV